MRGKNIYFFGEKITGVQNFEPLQNNPQRFEPQRNAYQHIIPRSIGSIIRGFKIGVTKWFRQNTDIYVVWQRNLPCEIKF